MATRKPASRKPVARKPEAATPKVKPATAAPASDAPVEGVSLKAGDAAPAQRPSIRKKELFARVKARSGKVKGSDVRQVLDAVLDELGAMLVAGETLNAQPLGTLKVQKHRPLAGADVVVCKLRRKKAAGGGKDPLAAAAE